MATRTTVVLSDDELRALGWLRLSPKERAAIAADEFGDFDSKR